MADIDPSAWLAFALFAAVLWGTALNDLRRFK